MNTATISPPRPANPRFASDAQKWAAVQRRDPRANGTFVFSVKTTGVYCRPSCASRPPRRENVAFHASPAAAERAGFRPCKRCQPDGPDLAAQHATKVAQACRILETRDPAPGLTALATEVGMSAAHFHRLFRKITGVSPKAYAIAHRAKSVRGQLRRNGHVTDAIYAAGYPSSGRFYAKSARTLGMKPSIYAQGGPGETIRYAIGRSSLGSVLVAATAKGVCAIFLGDDPQKLASDLRQRFARAELIPGNRAFARTVAQAVALVENPGTDAALPLDIRGTLFQQKVWRALTAIPSGQTTTYGEIARRIGRPRAVRAVGTACGANKIAVAIPCHRVVQMGGQLAGYRWGLERKRALLERESAAAQKTA